ncbi:hypothetical protein SLS62_005581 [Diatrype stigma]|uniref:Uncharacterized protein n=1 Tax=Diatrype stigma TaxID=117547 RepID=A0AAN9UR88_9PEZI
MSASGGLWAPAVMKLARSAAYKASKILRDKVVNAARPVNTALEPVLARSQPRQPIHPSALLRQQKNRRWHSTSSPISASTYRNINAAIRRFMSTGRLEAAPKLDRSKFAKTQVGRAVSQFTGRAPFASALRPNLTGGALPRTAGGYGLGSGRVGGARYFSHTPAAPAQVVQNVSAAVRAFWVSGQKAQFNGLSPRGEAQYRAVSAKQDEATRKMATFPRLAPGSYVDFRLNPTVTALSPLAAAFPFPSGSKVAAFDDVTLNTEGFIDVLSGDFARAVKDLTATLADIQRLCSLGDLPIQLEKGYTLRVRFPGVDAETVESLCDDLGLTRGTVGEDLNFEEETGVPMALKFPFAPGPAAEDTRTPAVSSHGSGSVRSEDESFPADDLLFESLDEMAENPWNSSPGLEGYESMSPPISSGEHASEDFEGLEGIYRFLEECDRSRDSFR